MEWKEFIVYTANEAVDAVANLLNEHGANGVVIADMKDVEKAEARQEFGEIYDICTEDYPVKGVQIKAYFHENAAWYDKQAELTKVIRNLKAYDIFLGDLHFETQTVKEADWENEWKNYFHVQKVTDRLTIVPKWEKYEADENEGLIYIDPGMAFGTGTHPTTILSLQALETLVNKEDIVLDVGVGSGVLSIGACLLGASHVYGYDLDPVAVKSASLNRDLNGMTTQITLAEKNLLRGNTHRANLIVSNILAEILVDLVEDAYQALYPGGHFITSGIIKDKEVMVENKLLTNGFDIVKKANMEQWVSIIARKKE